MKKKTFASLIVLMIGLVVSACNLPQPAPPTPLATKTMQDPATPTPAPTETAQPAPAPNAAAISSIEETCSANPIPPELLASPPQVKNDTWIAFNTSYHSDIYWDYADVYVVRFDGSGLKQLTYSPKDDGNASWSPDGKKILFHSDRTRPECPENDLGCSSDLFSINPDGTDSGKLLPVSPSYPGRSPDGKYIAARREFYDPFRVEHGLGDYLSNIFVATVKGSDVKNITGELQPGLFSDVDWSPTGQQFAFTGITSPLVFPGNSDGYWPRDVYLVNADGSDVRKLPGGPFGMLDRAEAWSPDGARLAFLTSKGIAIVNADGSGLSEHTIEQNLGERSLFWLDDGQHLVFTDADDDYYKIKPDFSGLEKLALDTEIDKLIYRFTLLKSRTISARETKMRLSPDGKWIAYFSCSGQIRVISTETRESYLVLDNKKGMQDFFKAANNVQPWGFGSDLEWAPDSRLLIFTYDTSYNGVNHVFRNLFAINIDASGLRQIDVGIEVRSPAVQP